jgi:iron complex transport system substrate-binding protein
MRSVDDILGMIETLGSRLVGAEARRLALVGELEAQIGNPRHRRRTPSRSGRKPRVYFEEWDEPLISGIRWASELIELAGGEDVFAERARSPLAKDRMPTAEVIAAAPDIIIGSWCGKHFRPGTHRRPAGLGEHPCRARRPPARNQVGGHPDPGPDRHRRGLARPARHFDL